MNPWLQSLCAAAISGGAGAIAVLLSAGFDWKNWKTACSVAATGAVLGVVLFLRQTPWPRKVWTPEERAQMLSGGKP
jgi:uncharacterized membrane protein YfcA